MATRDKISNGFHRIYDTETMLTIETRSNAAKAIFKEILEKSPRKSSADVRLFIRRDTNRLDGNKNIFIISKSWNTPAKDIVLPVGESILQPSKKIESSPIIEPVGHAVNTSTVTSETQSSEVIVGEKLTYEGILQTIELLRANGFAIVQSSSQILPDVESIEIRLGNTDIPVKKESIVKVNYKPGITNSLETIAIVKQLLGL